MGMTEKEKIMLRMQDVLAAMREAKPGDRSESDRRWAVSITKYEEAMAVFLYQMTMDE